ncbi:MAG: HNH endonuclease [Alphaproteobacteria bacterium]|nr:HNH endonuclease [Alphaproteobacteria bacterium]
MPSAPRTFRLRPQRTKRDRDQEHDERRRREKPWRNWYKSKAWAAIRLAQLTAQPFCERCDRRGEVTIATVVNHTTPHRGNWTLFLAGPFESCCKPCHDGEVQREERRAART